MAMKLPNEGTSAVTAPTVPTVTFAGSATFSREEGQKLGGLFHDAAEITAAIVMTQGLKQDAALVTFDTILVGLIQRRKALEG